MKMPMPKYKGKFWGGAQRTSVKMARTSKKMWPKMRPLWKK